MRVEAHGGYLGRYEDVDVSWLQSLGRDALQSEGVEADDCGLLVTVIPGQRVVRFAFDGPHTYGRQGARWYLHHHAFARRLSEHLHQTVSAYCFDPEELEQVINYGNGRRVGGELLRYEEVELDDEADDDDASFEAMKQKWPLGHLARVLGVERDVLIKLPRQSSALIELATAAQQGPLWRMFPNALQLMDPLPLGAAAR
jgi:hypothetical protein